MVTINNLPEKHKRYVVARLVQNELWYWGSWNDRRDADDVALTFDNGIVVDMEGEK